MNTNEQTPKVKVIEVDDKAKREILLRGIEEEKKLREQFGILEKEVNRANGVINTEKGKIATAQASQHTINGALTELKGQLLTFGIDAANMQKELEALDGVEEPKDSKA